MNQTFEASGFRLEMTADGSPTLKHSVFGESMHHSGGAAAETWYIYGHVMQKLFEAAEFEKKTMHVASIGLGLGYIEMLFAGLHGKDAPVTLDSFEIIPALQENFKNWYAESAPVDPVYSLAYKSLRNPHFNLSEIEIKQRLQSSLITYWGDFLTFKEFRQWNVICFDAFSKKSNANLWTPEFLSSFLKTSAAANCVFTTYACTGALKTALKENHFTLLNRPGFSGKRDSTLAIRGEFMSRVFQTF